MKHLTAFLLLLPGICVLGQVQTGLVREINSKHHPLGGVYIHFEDALPTTSETKGDFQLRFVNKKPGDFIYPLLIRKEGYENYIEQKKVKLAIAHCTQFLHFSERLYLKDGEIAKYKSIYGVANMLLASLYAKKEPSKAKKLYELAKKLYLELSQDFPNYPDYKTRLGIVEQGLKKLQK